jgi:hypothetical protein
MGLVICASKSEASKISKVNGQISEMCKHVIPHEDQLLFIAEPGKLMDLLRILKENNIAYHFQDFAFKV